MLEPHPWYVLLSMFPASPFCHDTLLGATFPILGQQGSQHILKTVKLDEFAATELNPETLATELPETGDHEGNAKTKLQCAG